MPDTINQIALLILSVSAMILVAQKNKWGFVVGLSSQPFWLITSFTHQQWGVFINTVIYIGVWIYGIYMWFYKSPLDMRKVSHGPDLTEKNNGK